jgi:acyl carrier protein
MPNRSEIEMLVIESVRLLADDFEIDALRQADASSRLYGTDGSLDSMALVNLIADIEEAVDEKFGASIALADEKAMSAKHSPFRDVSSLTDATKERIEA